jgi:DNA-binding transcriptional ArsR family regulator
MISLKLVKDATLVLRAVNNKFRQQLLELLGKQPHMSVTEIQTALKWDQTVTSQHLSILRKVGIVDSRRDAKFVYYSINNERLRNITRLCEKLTGVIEKDVPSLIESEA